jgi:hypothetical protein
MPDLIWHPEPSDFTGFPPSQGFSGAKKFNIFYVGYQKLVSMSITNKNSQSNYDKLNMAVL